MLWENGTFRFRDIHLFDEDVESPYLAQRGTSEACSFYTLPFVDGFQWSSTGQIAGLRLKAMVGEKEVLLEGGDIQIDDSLSGKLHISWPLMSTDDTLTIDMNEKQLSVKTEGNKSFEWYLEFTSAKDAVLPFKRIDKNQVSCRFMEVDYTISCVKGAFVASEDGRTFRIEPEQNGLVLKFFIGKDKL